MIGRFGKKDAWSAAFLLVLNLIAHFVPFERTGHHPDHYSMLVVIRGRTWPEILTLALHAPDRPLNCVMAYSLARLFGSDSAAQVVPVFLSSGLLAVIVYLLLRDLLADRRQALVGAVVYVLLPNRLELYGSLIYASMNICFCLYLMSLLQFLRFVKDGRHAHLFLALTAYAAAIFCYELGFFLPLVLLAVACVYDSRRVREAAWFFLPAMFYLVYRFTLGFGLYHSHPRVVDLGAVVPNVLWRIPNQFLGRYALRSVAYGLKGFTAMEAPAFSVALAADFALLALAVRFVGRRELGPLPREALRIAVVIFAAFLLPSALYSVDGRHTGLASVGFALAAVAVLSRLGRYWRHASVALLLALLPVSQGTAWNQIVAGRINHAVLQTIREHRDEIRHSARVVFDSRSFADRIGYTWGETKTNVFNYYWGVPLAPWGMTSMVRLVLEEKKPVYVATTALETVGGRVLFQVRPRGPDEPYPLRVVPLEGTFIIDVRRVFGTGFINGRRPQRAT
jgi:hypothetical protein